METVVRPACRALLRLVSLLLPAATAIAQPAPRLDAAGFLPPAPGTTWVYEIHSGGETRLVTKRITRVLRFEGAPCVEISVQEGTGVGQPGRYEYFALRRDGIVQVGGGMTVPGLYEARSGGMRALWLATPVGVTPAWNVSTTNGLPRAALQGIGEVVEVPAGRFACARVEYTTQNPAAKQVFEYAPGICVVRDRSMHNGQVVRSAQLTRFHAGTVFPDPPPHAVAAALGTAEANVVELTHPFLVQQLESRFFRIGTGEHAHLARSFRGRITPFALDSSSSWQELLDDERITMASGPVAVLPNQNNVWITMLSMPPLAAALLDVLLHRQDVPDGARVVPEKLQTSVGADPERLLRISVDARIDAHTRRVQIETRAGRIRSVTIQP